MATFFGAAGGVKIVAGALGVVAVAVVVGAGPEPPPSAGFADCFEHALSVSRVPRITQPAVIASFCWRDLDEDESTLPGYVLLVVALLEVLQIVAIVTSRCLKQSQTMEARLKPILRRLILHELAATQPGKPRAAPHTPWCPGHIFPRCVKPCPRQIRLGNSGLVKCSTRTAKRWFRMGVVTEPVRIGILGDFNPEFRSHAATNDSLQHAARRLGCPVESEWLPTPSLLAPEPGKLESFDGLWASAGSPYKCFDGMLKGIEFARVHDWPFLATCGGFQYTLIECARNVVGIKDATTAEEDPGAKNIVIYPVSCAVPNRAENAPKLSGVVSKIRLRPGSYLVRYYGQEEIEEEFLCNFEVNPVYEWTAMEAGFPVVARGPQEECRAIESPTQLFFIATLVQPQLSSRPE